MTPPSNFFSFMHLLLFFSLFNLIVIAHCTSFAQALCHDDERSSLLQFKDSLIINKSICYDSSAHSKVASWKAEDCCSWEGVTCNKVTGHLIRLDLTSSCLYGSINSTNTLFHLVHLEWLSLANNDFNGSEIPSGIINLSMLSYLNLSDSSFSGQIPWEILELSKLKTLDTSFNRNMKLQKPGLRSLVEKLTHLKVLFLDEVNISSSIPYILANFSSFTALSLAKCELHGEFPAKIFQLPNLQYISVLGNENLFGYLSEFEMSSPLQHLILRDTRFSGEIPYSIGNLRSLVDLDIKYCAFLGSIPSSLGNLSSLEKLSLGYNNFSSQDSCSLSWIAKCSKLTYLGLPNINIVGEIPSWLMNLTRLTLLDMSNSNLNGPIPYWLMNLNHLECLFLFSNRLTGRIPFEIRNLTQLSVLDLESNQLQGPFPSALYDLKNLRLLNVGSNNLSSIMDMDMLLHKLESLVVLTLSSNNLSLLTKTNFHTKFAKLKLLGLQSCNLIEFLDFLQNQDQLLELDLSSNKIVGRIPSWFFSFSTYLVAVNLSSNLLTGFDQGPVSFSRTGIVSLDLRSNKLQGSLPIPPLDTMTYLVSYNNFTGEIPPSICNLNSLEVLDLSHNNLSGKLPQCLANLSRLLSTLSLQSNKFHGSIPQNLLNGTNLSMIDLSRNQLQGRIPRSLVSCTKLEFLNLGNNQIRDTFPSWLETLPKLKVLILQSNRLRGAIKEPKTNYAFPELLIIDLSHNRFTGNLPSKFFQFWNAMKVVNAGPLAYLGTEISFKTGELERLSISFHVLMDYGYSLQMSTKGIELEYGKISNLLTAIIFSDNKFGGEIPTSIAKLRGLHFLSLSNNNLKGPIPAAMGNLTALESLDLSHNKLSGQIPQQLVDLTFLSYFNVSNNHLTGRIPQGKQFDTFENISFDGNPGLCGKQIAKECEDFKPSNIEEDPAGSKFPFEFGWKIVLTGYASGIIVGVALEHAFSSRKKVLFMKFCERKLINAFGRK